MLKIKYLHRRSRSEKSDAYWKTKKYWKIKNINLFSDSIIRTDFSVARGYFIILYGSILHKQFFFF